MNKTTTRVPVLSEKDAKDGNGLFVLDGKEAMTIHYYKKTVLKIAPLANNRDANKDDSEVCLNFFGTTGYYFWAKAHALNNRYWEKCHIFFKKDLDFYFKQRNDNL